jgi:glutathione synthase/RimK-type ligase-like ATP-grasp enzyme
VIIASHSDDHVPLVELYLKEPYVIIDPQHIADGTALSYEWSEAAPRVMYDGKPLDDVHAVWCRSLLHAADAPHLQTVDAAYREYCRTATSRFINALSVQFTDAYWLSPYAAMQRAANKPLQLTVARQVGFSVPDTLITSDAVAARRFVDARPATIIKTLVPQIRAATAGKRTVSFATVVHPGQSLDYSALPLAPLIFQTAIDCAADIRVVVVDGKVFASKILTQQPTGGSARDWRVAQFEGGLQVEAYVLPAAVRRACMVLIKQLGLTFGIVDLVLDTNGHLWFLENNTTGAWGFMEHAQSDIAQAVAHALASRLP